MVRKKEVAADFNPAEFDPAYAEQQTAETQQAAAQQHVQHVAEATATPPGNGHAVQHAPRSGHSAAVGKREFKKHADPFGAHTILLSPDPKGPRARLLRSNDNQAMLIQFSENPGKEITDQLKSAGLHWERRAESDFAKGAWIIHLEQGNEWRNHALAEQVFRDVVNQLREKNGMEAFVPGAGQAV